MQNLPIVLASSSPQRKLLLERLDIPFTVDASLFDESLYEEVDPVSRCTALARLKAQERAEHHPNSIVIGGDSLVVSSSGVLLEKPKSKDEAREMLCMQRGSVSVVHSALCVIDTSSPLGMTHEKLDSSNVHFADFSDDILNWWVEGEYWQGRAGGFQIEGIGCKLIEKIDGDFAAIWGLPTRLLMEVLDEIQR